MGWAKSDFEQFEELKNKIDDLSKRQNAFYENTTNELAQRLIRRVKQKSPVGAVPDVNADTFQEFWSGYQGGTLRKNWKASPVKRQGAQYAVEVYNPIEYASYVEYGHRQARGRYVPALGRRLVSPWVKGVHMLESSVKEIQAIAPKIIDKRAKEYFNGI